MNKDTDVIKIIDDPINEDELENLIVTKNQQVLEEPTIPKKSEILEELVIPENKGPVAPEKQDDLEELVIPEKQEILEEPVVPKKQEDLEELVIPEKQETLERLVIPEKQETLEDPVVPEKQENLEELVIPEKQETLEKHVINDSQERKSFKEESDNPNDYVDKLLDEKLTSMRLERNVFGIGKVTKVSDFIIEIVGFEDVSFYEKVNIDNKAIGYVMKLETNHVIVAVLEMHERIAIGDPVYQTNEEFMGEFSEEAMGRIIDLFGNDKLTNKKFSNTQKISIEKDPIAIMDRKKVERPLETGIVGIDLIYPIGKGQRQLIIGDKKTGKTQISLDIIANQLNKKMICIYVAIGKTKKEIKEIYYELLKRKAMDYTIIITAFYDDLPSVLTLTPYFALSVADLYMQKGQDVLVVLDDLKKHADAYREISLIFGKSPGRDAYPADIFYFHSRLLERGCQYKNGASITILPIVETKGEDITDYISTNIISITDGQIVLSSKNFNKGEKPAINYGLSVSRLGGAVQENDMKELGSKVRQKLLSYLETREIYELANVDEMSKELQQKLVEGKKLLDNLMQYKFSPLTKEQIKQRFKESEDIQDG